MAVGENLLVVSLLHEIDELPISVNLVQLFAIAFVGHLE